MARDLDFIEAMTVLSLKPDDVVVLKTSLMLNCDQVRFLEEKFGQVSPNKVMVLHGGLDLAVLRVDAV